MHPLVGWEVTRYANLGAELYESLTWSGLLRPALISQLGPGITVPYLGAEAIRFHTFFKRIEEKVASVAKTTGIMEIDLNIREPDLVIAMVGLKMDPANDIKLVNDAIVAVRSGQLKEASSKLSELVKSLRRFADVKITMRMQINF